MTGSSGKSANPWWRRLQLAWQALLGRQRHKSNETRFRDFGELRSKQVAFPDSAEARRVETLLRESAALELFPPFMFRLESTVWVRFVPGHRPNPRDPGDLDALCRFFTELYKFRPVECRLDQTDLQPRLIELEELAERLRPQTVWTGLDYIDALAKNFIIGERGAVGVDIEAIGDGELLGTGLAKARHRWLDEAADPFLDALVAGGGPDLRPQYAYTQLQFLADYGVQNLVRGKQGRIRADDFDALLSAASNADGSRQP